MQRQVDRRDHPALRRKSLCQRESVTAIARDAVLEDHHGPAGGRLDACSASGAVRHDDQQRDLLAGSQLRKWIEAREVPFVRRIREWRWRCGGGTPCRAQYGRVGAHAARRLRRRDVRVVRHGDIAKARAGVRGQRRIDAVQGNRGRADRDSRDRRGGIENGEAEARSVSRVATVLKWKDTTTFAGFSASGPSAGFAATSRCEAVKPQAPCIGAFGSVAQFAGLMVAPSVDLMVA